MKQTLTQFLVSIMEPKRRSNTIQHRGRIISVSPINIHIGTTVITPDGLGEIRMIIPNWISKKPELVDVYLYRGYRKRYNVLLLRQYVIYHKHLGGRFILLSPNNYRYIYKDKQIVDYRVTNRMYAQLTQTTKEHYTYVKTIHKQRGGLGFLRILDKFNLEIKKKN